MRIKERKRYHRNACNTSLTWTLLKVKEGHGIYREGLWETGHSEVLWGKQAGCADKRRAIRAHSTQSRAEGGMTSHRWLETTHRLWANDTHHHLGTVQRRWKAQEWPASKIPQVPAATQAQMAHHPHKHSEKPGKSMVRHCFKMPWKYPSKGVRKVIWVESRVQRRGPD